MLLYKNSKERLNIYQHLEYDVKHLSFSRLIH